MWARALARTISRGTVDRGGAVLPLRWPGAAGAIGQPVAITFTVYAAAYAAGVLSGRAHWDPGHGAWTSAAQVAANVTINLAILAVAGTFSALGEELGWRGYLQPRLDQAGARGSVLIVWLCEVGFHLPLIAAAGYIAAGPAWLNVGLFAAGALPTAFIWAQLAYRARSVWPAVVFHSAHNAISQWLFPHLFFGGNDELWLGESGLLPVLAYTVIAAVFLVRQRRAALTWRELAARAPASAGD